jgi:hypothetical protein
VEVKSLIFAIIHTFVKQLFDMTISTFQFWNRSVGWSVFTIALITYGLTVEPTASFWDAGEYIATSAKLQVGHPPGAPLFQMIGAFFALFANSPENVALMVNYMSVFSSAFSVLFLFWTLTLLIKKLPAFENLNNTPPAFDLFWISRCWRFSVLFFR